MGSVCKGEIGSPVISKSSYHSWEITSGTEADVITCVLLSGKTSQGSRRGAYDRYKNVESQASGLEIMPLNTPGAPQKQPGNALKLGHRKEQREGNQRHGKSMMSTHLRTVLGSGQALPGWLRHLMQPLMKFIHFFFQ